MPVRILSADVHLLDLRTRLPFRYGIATMTETPHALIRVRAEVDGRPAEGVAADHLPPKWFSKDPERDFAGEIDDMLAVIGNAHSAARGMAAESVFRLWRDLYSAHGAWGRRMGFPPLLTNFGTSLIERALIDAFCRAKQTSFAQAVHTNAFGIRLGEIDAALGDSAPAEWLPQRPLRTLTIRQTIGMADAITDADIAEAERVDDGLPQSLDGLVARYGFRHFKIKVSGEASADVDRIRRILAVAQDRRIDDYRYTVDANELFRSLAEFRDYWENVSGNGALSGALSRLLFIEQPLHRDVALDESCARGFADWNDRPPIIIDESDAELDSLPRALQLGYDGTSHKNCKGVFKSLLNACRLERLRRLPTGRRRPLVMSVEDLVNIGPVALLQDLAVAATLGMTSVERNGHHYFAGLSAFPAAVREQTLTDHGDLYERGPAGIPFVRIEEGAMDVGSVVDAPFGVEFELDVDRFDTVDAWRERRTSA